MVFCSLIIPLYENFQPIKQFQLALAPKFANVILISNKILALHAATNISDCTLILQTIIPKFQHFYHLGETLIHYPTSTKQHRNFTYGTKCRKQGIQDYT